MGNFKKYLKYYFLEDYLFAEVGKNFQKNHHLAPEEFFAIVIWKSNRAKTNVRRGIEKSKKTIRTITSEVFQAKTPEQKFDILTSISGIGVPMASAILTVCYPKEFTVVDYRAVISLISILENNNSLIDKNEIKASIKKWFGTNPSNSIKAYLIYLEKCKELAGKHKFSLRDFDRILFGKDFYEGANGLKRLAGGAE